MDTKTTLTITAVHIGMVKPKRSSSDDDNNIVTNDGALLVTNDDDFIAYN